MIRKLLILAVIFGCWQCKTKTPTTSNSTGTKTTPKATPVSRGTIRVVAQIVKVKPINKNAANALCGKNPCEATIKIEKVIGKGAFFNGDVDNGKSFDAFFVKTLAPTKNLYPNLQKHFPGLKNNDRFQADIIYNMKASEGSKYQVITYEKL